jgi:hypothetical protein
MTPRDLIGDTSGELTICQTARLARLCTDYDLGACAHASGKLTPRRVPGLAGKGTGESPMQAEVA